MKKLVIATILALFLATSTFALGLNIVGCTRDQKAATLSLDLIDSVSQEIFIGIMEAFEATANYLTAEDLVSQKGFEVFRSNLSEEEFNAIEGFNGPPVIGGDCTK